MDQGIPQNWKDNNSKLKDSNKNRLYIKKSTNLVYTGVSIRLDLNNNLSFYAFCYSTPYSHQALYLHVELLTLHLYLHNIYLLRKFLFCIGISSIIRPIITKISTHISSDFYS